MDGTLAHAATGAAMIREHFEREGWALIERFLTLRDVDSLRSTSDELAAPGAMLDYVMPGTRSPPIP